MKIVQLTAENIKRLRAVSIKPDGSVVEISGKNGQGKTSILDSIFWALAGTKSLQDKPIRKGEQKARIKLDLGTITVERKFHTLENGETATQLIVENAEGARYPSPQTMLDALLGHLSFDPLAFARMEPSKQLAELRRVVSIEVDVDELDRLNKGDYAKRTDVNREAKQLRAAAAAIVIPDAPAQAEDAKTVAAELREVVEQNTRTAAEAAERRRLADELSRALNESAELVRRAERVAAEAGARYEQEIAAAKARLDTEKAEVADLGEQALAFEQVAHQKETQLAGSPATPLPIDLAPIEYRLQAAQAAALALARRDAALEQQESNAKRATALEESSRRITAQMEARDKAKADAIAKAKFPIEGLSFGDGAVVFNGIPFDQASSAEQLRVSMALAMATNPKLRVIRITDGSLLDEDSMAAIADMATAADFQVWIEMVDSSGKVGVVIEDGAVKSTPESRARDSDDEDLLGRRTVL